MTLYWLRSRWFLFYISCGCGQRVAGAGVLLSLGWAGHSVWLRHMSGSWCWLFAQLALLPGAPSCGLSMQFGFLIIVVGFQEWVFQEIGNSSWPALKTWIRNWSRVISSILYRSKQLQSSYDQGRGGRSCLLIWEMSKCVATWKWPQMVSTVRSAELI